jgi:MFS family permease
MYFGFVLYKFQLLIYYPFHAYFPNKSGSCMKTVFRQYRQDYNKIITLACFSIQAVGVGCYFSYGVFFNPLMEAFGWSRAAIAGASSVSFFVSGLFAILVGRLNDRFGPRLLMSIASVFMGLGFALIAPVSSLFQLYLVFGLIFGIGLSSVDIIALSTITRWFTVHRGKMTGLVKVGTGAGQFICPILASYLIVWTGFQNAFIIMGVCTFIILIVIAQLLYRDPDIYYGGAGTEKDDIKNSRIDYSAAIISPKLWLLCIANFFFVFCMLSVIIHIVPYGRDIGMAQHQAAGVLGAIGAVSMAGRFACGLIIDRIGTKPIITACSILLLIALLWLLQADALWELYAFTLVYGIAHGGYFTAISPIVAELFGIRAHSSLLGIVVFFGTSGGALGPFVTGYLFDIFLDYSAAFRMLILITCLAFGLILCLKVNNIKEKI